MLPGLAETQPQQAPIQSAQPIQQAPQQQAQQSPQPTQPGLAQAGQPIENPQEQMMEGGQENPQENMQEQQAPQQQLKPFTGTVKFEGKSYEVKDGIVHAEGHEFNVFQVGSTALDIVIAEGGKFVGIVQNGEFIEATAEMIAQLKQQGILQ